jgi:hypothetical protein
MKRLIKPLAVLMLMLCVAPAPLLVAPQKAHAQFAVLDAANLIKNTISSIATVSTEINTWAVRIKDYVLDPAAFILSGNLLKSITAGIIDFVNGNNSSGNPLYVQDLRSHLLATGDVQAVNFFAEFGRNSNSPFASSILSSLRMNYLQGTSANGYWAANQCTLNRYSPNPLAFANGDFSQGGWGAWFALTTQPQNNPYYQYYRAQAELSARVENAVANQLTQLAWGQGFLSWCGDSSGAPAPAGDPQCPAGQEWSSEFETCVPTAVAAIDGGCTKSDGSQGKIQTPGSVIRDGLNEALGTDIRRLINVGDVNTIFNNVGNVLSIMSYGASLLGGNGGSGGLFGVSHASGANPVPLLDQYRNQPGYFGLTQQTVNQSANTPPPPNPNLQNNAAAAQNALPQNAQQNQNLQNQQLLGI